MVFESPSKLIDKDVILDASLTVHSDRDTVVLENLWECLAYVMGGVIGVEDFCTSLMRYNRKLCLKG